MKKLPFVFLALISTILAAPAADSPNIITVFIDDMGYIDLSTFGGELAATVHVDQLASEGIKFSQFYVNSPICSPSRVALTTGQYPHRWRITSYLNNRKSNRERGVAQWLDLEAPVLARELQKKGYATGHFGKWHMGGQRDVGEAPLISEYGFDESLTNFEGMGDRILGFKDAYDGKKPKLHTLGSDELGRGEIITMDRSIVTGAFVDRAIAFIDDAAEAKKPFFVNVWPDDVHGPWFPPEILRKATDGSKRALHYAVVKAMDDQLAPLFKRIREDDALRDNTLIVLCSDNGHEHGAGMSDPFRGSKTWLYEGGIRSPLIVWGPGLIAEDAVGTVNDTAIFSAIDLNRSLYALTDTDLPEGAELDGENVVEALLGKSETGRVAPIFFRRPPDRPGFSQGIDEDNPDLAVRDGQWKFLINYDKSDPQLYNLDADISESRNVISEHPEVAKRLESAVFEWNTQMPRDAGDPDYAPAKPNIVVMLADDCTFRDLGVYGGQAKTPHLDGLAAEAMKFERCFQAAPMCSPTRHNLYTGIYPVKSGAYPNHTFIKPGVKSIVQHLKPLDYRVALSGKTHISPKTAFPFEYSRAEGPGTKGPDFEAIETLIRESQADGNPFCQIVCSNEPHEPYTKGDPSQYPVEDIELPPYLLDTPETRAHFQKYLAEITFYDSEVGQVLDILERTGAADNTLVMILSEQGNAFPFAKWTLHDAGLRSGMIVRWPDHVAGGSSTEAMVEYVDVLPTVLDAVGGRIPKRLEGKSFLPVLKGETDQHKKHVYGVMTTRGINAGSAFYGSRSVRSETHKLIRNLTPEAEFRNVIVGTDYFKEWKARAEAGDEQAKTILDDYHTSPEYELYDVIADPLELTNLASDPALSAVKAELVAKLDSWMAQQGDEGQATEMAALERMTREPKSKRLQGKGGKGKGTKGKK